MPTVEHRVRETLFQLGVDPDAWSEFSNQLNDLLRDNGSSRRVANLKMRKAIGDVVGLKNLAAGIVDAEVRERVVEYADRHLEELHRLAESHGLKIPGTSVPYQGIEGRGGI